MSPERLRFWYKCYPFQGILTGILRGIPGKIKTGGCQVANPYPLHAYTFRFLIRRNPPMFYGIACRRTYGLSISGLFKKPLCSPLCGHHPNPYPLHAYTRSRTGRSRTKKEGLEPLILNPKSHPP
jgi:hypothetical protein